MDAVFERRIIMENNPANELNESLKTIFSFPKAIKYLGLAFMHYRVGMERRPPDEKKEE